MADDHTHLLAKARRNALASGFDKTRQSPFSYQCNRCGHCCHAKAIQVNPYEIARLAAHLGISTTQFIAEFTVADGAFLTSRASDQACIFFGGNGCTVHSDRPLVCRIYPLGRHVTANGEEQFADVVPHPATKGDYGTGGTVDDYLRIQGAEPYITAADAYLELLKRLLARLANVDADAEAVDVSSNDDELRQIALDMDLAVGQYCAREGLPFPSDVEEKAKHHIVAIEKAIAN